MQSSYILLFRSLLLRVVAIVIVFLWAEEEEEKECRSVIVSFLKYLYNK